MPISEELDLEYPLTFEPESAEELELQCGLKWQSLAGQKKNFFKSIPPVQDDTGVDLFSLFISVEARGGFDNTANWDNVALNCNLMAYPSNKLSGIYKKYLLQYEDQERIRLRDLKKRN
ncbi:uncharacterized protein LOC124461223 [Drosophila willistoni]|uniref:uncharacterized protein LOC124461223 n=1 Tax=Drosophila willistoni TaxID=7260 RepID=UPI001F077929|nr:uncharacterized protein LOC124461223 [Drosophila willistoni]